MVAFEGLYVPEHGDLSPAYAPVRRHLAARHGARFPLRRICRPEGSHPCRLPRQLGEVRAAALQNVQSRRADRGRDRRVGIEIVRELEIYHEAGLTPAEALATATIMPARLVGQDKKTGSIKVGKTADLVLVEGDPSVRLADLRQTRVVMMDGKLMDADALRTAAGFSGRPK